MELKDRVVLVTGASERIGRLIALDLAAQGVAVAVHCHQDAMGADETVRMIAAAGGRARRLQGDLATAEGVESVIAAMAAFGRWDGLVNAASRFSTVSIDDISQSQFGHDQALHARAPFFLSRALYLHRKGMQYPEPGCVVNITDTRVTRPAASRPSYNLAKAALAEMTRVLAVSLAPAVRVNAVAPGAVMPSEPAERAYFSRLERTVPLKRLATAQQVVSAVRFFFENDGVTGQALAVDAGEHLQ